ncbi:MAG: hypothetical protein A3C11_01215 [Candidatus Sungbacteria bacterium RIFCSPHIGHO2_02_FULL_49_12]|uniref:Uncharacterized protein n=1 Tax=Candidatus Sungbacteria bacterium RIFCSPHIGHO2_02_FULL_49_12 TaxID=1802271 RepID=A0A1G2KPA1_9BACT|nr:MAG: hypothetical protein A3C11_01215 [Candidatus Sungbacteria bacterium RIFCSPHIGHO2_02_FULL_49_12]
MCSILLYNFIMKPVEKQRARNLRSQGYSINDIFKKLGVAKSTASFWVRDIELTKQQKQKLSAKGVSKELIERRRITRLTNENCRRQKIINDAEIEIDSLNNRELWLIGSILYWAEGGKTQRSLVRFTNGDPKMLKFMMKYLRKICQVPESKFRGYVHIHPHLDYRKAEKHWSEVTEIPLKQFFKTYRKRSIAGKHKRDSLPFGTLDIYVCNTELFLKITGWVQGIFRASGILK